MVKNNKAILIEPHLFGTLTYFQLIFQYDTVIIHDDSHFKKQTNRNRFEILMSDGRRWCIIPIHYKSGMKLSEVKIDYHQDWSRTLIRTLQTAYNGSPFFKYYVADILELFNRKQEYLVDLSFDMLSFCLKSIRSEKKLNLMKRSIFLKESSQFEPWDDFTDFFNKKEKIHENNNSLPKVYPQVFGSVFEENMSILDALFNTGPEIRHLIY